MIARLRLQCAQTRRRADLKDLLTVKYLSSLRDALSMQADAAENKLVDTSRHVKQLEREASNIASQDCEG